MSKRNIHPYLRNLVEKVKKEQEEKERKFIEDNGVKEVKITIDDDIDDDNFFIFEIDKYNNLYIRPKDDYGDNEPRIKIGNLERFIKELTNKKYEKNSKTNV